MANLIAFGALGVVGIVLAITGTVIMGVFPKILRDGIVEGVKLRNESDNFKMWINIPIPIFIKFYIFNLNNSKTYTNLADIQLIEQGPYVFEKFLSKEQIRFYENEKNESLVQFRERRRYKFRPELSNGKYDDEVTFINMPIMAIIFNQELPDGKFGYEMFKSDLDDNEKGLFTTRKVGDLLFDGIELKIMQLAGPMMPKDTGISFPEDGKFSIEHGKDVLGDQMSVFTGIDSMEKFGQVYEVNGKYSLTNDDPKHSLVWPYHDPACNKFKGTDGSIFPPDVSKNDVLYAYGPGICRSAYLSYLEESSVKDIPTYRFHVPKEYYDSPKHYDGNACYCLNKNLNKCNKRGIVEISHCLGVSGGAPVVLSAPYFYMGEKSFRDDINLKPQLELTEENYGTFMDVEPMTGGPLSARRRAQFNIRIRHSDAIPQLNATKNDREYYIPVMWIEETAEIDDKLADNIKSNLLGTKNLVNRIAISVIIVGVLLVITAIVLVAKNAKEDSQA